jgi:hypothetical protein
VHSSDGWDNVVEADRVALSWQGFAQLLPGWSRDPEVYEFLEAEAIKWAISLPAKPRLTRTNQLSAQTRWPSIE